MPQGLHRHCEDVLHASCPFTPSEGVMFSRVFSTPSEGVGLLLGPVMICGSQMYHICPFWFVFEGVHPADTPQKACTGCFGGILRRRCPAETGKWYTCGKGLTFRGTLTFPGDLNFIIPFSTLHTSPQVPNANIWYSRSTVSCKVPNDRCGSGFPVE